MVPTKRIPGKPGAFSFGVRTTRLAGVTSYPYRHQECLDRAAQGKFFCRWPATQLITEAMSTFPPRLPGRLECASPPRCCRPSGNRRSKQRSEDGGIRKTIQEPRKNTEKHGKSKAGSTPSLLVPKLLF